jgi:hypothetical protein
MEIIDYLLLLWEKPRKRNHRGDTYRAVTDRRKHCESLCFHVPTLFQATEEKMINCACSASSAGG